MECTVHLLRLSLPSHPLSRAAALEACETGSVIGGKQIRFANVAPDQGRRAVAGLVHDRPLRGAARRGTGCQALAQGVSRVPIRVEPTAIARRLTVRVMALSEAAAAAPVEKGSSERNTAPSAMRADSSRAWKTARGRCLAAEPYGMPMRRERPSWSVLDFRKVTARTALENSRSATSRVHQLGAAEGAGEPQEQQGAIPEAEHVRQARHRACASEGVDDGGRRLLAALGRAD